MHEMRPGVGDVLGEIAAEEVTAGGLWEASAGFLLGEDASIHRRRISLDRGMATEDRLEVWPPS